MTTKDTTPKSRQGEAVPKKQDESVSGLDVRQLLGLGRADAPVEAEPAVIEPSEAERIEPVGEAVETAPSVVEAPPSREEPEVEVKVEPEAPPLPVEPRIEPVSPLPTPSTLRAIDNEPAKTPPADIKSEQDYSADPPAQSRFETKLSQIVANGGRPIPPVTAPSELPGLRPSIDPLAASVSPSSDTAAEELVPPLETNGSAEPRRPEPLQAPDPSIAANAKLEELAALSERTLEDYETFDDFDGDEPERSKRTPFLILASLVSVGILAGGVVFAYRQGVKESNQTTLPIIKAETEPLKVQPSNPGGVKIPNQNKLIYDRILGEETDIAETIVPREEKAVTIAKLPASTEVIKTLPPGSGVVPPVPPAPDTTRLRVKPVGSPKTPATDGIQNAADNVVKKLTKVDPPKPLSPPTALTAPSGNTPVENLAQTDVARAIIPRAPVTPVPETTRPIVETLNLPARNAEPAAPPQAADSSSTPPPSDGIIRLETERVTGPPRVPSASETIPELAKEPETESSDPIKNALKTIAEPAANSRAKLPPVLPRSKPPAPQRAPTRLASNTAAQTDTAAPAERSSSSGRYVIQIAAFRSREEALSRYTRLKRRHASLLAPYTSFVQRADLGDRGVYYRLRLGPIAEKSGASELCRSLLAAGEKDCLVRVR